MRNGVSQSVELVGDSETTRSREVRDLNETSITLTFFLLNPLLG